MKNEWRKRSKNVIKMTVTSVSADDGGTERKGATRHTKLKEYTPGIK